MPRPKRDDPRTLCTRDEDVSSVVVPQRDNAAEYRRLAEESRAFAMLISLPEVRGLFLKMAEHWEMLADVAEQRQ
jgi:hypothetical protein